MHSSLQARRARDAGRVGIFADGVAVRRVGEETFRLAQQYVDEVIIVSTDEICAAIQDIFEDNRTIAEPAGALASPASSNMSRASSAATGPSSPSTAAPT